MIKPIDATTAQEYRTLKSFLYVFVELVAGRSPPALGELALEMDDIERRAPKRTLAGMRMAVNDCIEMSSHLPADVVVAMDAVLTSVGVLTLSEARRTFSAKVASILRRDRIRSDAEYCIVAALLADLSCGVSPEERQRLQAMAERYESGR